MHVAWLAWGFNIFGSDFVISFTIAIKKALKNTDKTILGRACQQFGRVINAVIGADSYYIE